MPDDTFRHDHVGIGAERIHVVEAGDSAARPVVFLHGFPESWYEWRPMMALAAGQQFRAIALDLPGVGDSFSSSGTPRTKVRIAETVHDVLRELDLSDVTLVGHDIGGMVVYAYLRAYTDIARAVIMDIVIPGVPPWEDFIRQPFLWHFALHATPNLPERLVQGRQPEYFDYFFDVLAADPEKITPEARAAYAAAYQTDDQLATAFGWFRAFPQDADHNRSAEAGPTVATPLLYMRGEKERSGSIDTYVEGLRKAGVTSVEQALVLDAGHFTQEEAPEQTWELTRRFIDGRSMEIGQ